MDELLFTPAAILDLLSKIDELKDKDIGVVESDNGIQLVVGESTYIISEESALDIEVSEEDLAAIDDACMDTYSDLSESADIDVDEQAIEGGIVGELAKTLLVGGLVRLTTKLFKGRK